MQYGIRESKRENKSKFPQLPTKGSMLKIIRIMERAGLITMCIFVFWYISDTRINKVVSQNIRIGVNGLKQGVFAWYLQKNNATGCLSYGWNFGLRSGV